MELPTCAQRDFQSALQDWIIYPIKSKYLWKNFEKLIAPLVSHSTYPPSIKHCTTAVWTQNHIWKQFSASSQWKSAYF